MELPKRTSLFVMRRARTVARVALSIGLIAVLSGGAWFVTGRVKARANRQSVADAWESLRVCLLGNGLRTGERPSKRMRAIAFTAPKADWPARCLGHAQQLDEATSTFSARTQFGHLPSSRAALEMRDFEERGRAVDKLWTSLRGASLPLPRHAVVAASKRGHGAQPARAPISQPALLKRGTLRAMGRTGQLDTAQYRIDDNQRLRLLLADGTLCHFHSTVREALEGENTSAESVSRWQTATCREAYIPLPKPRTLTLTEAEAGGVDLIYARRDDGADGLYDAVTGQRIWRPRFTGAQAFVKRSGATNILYARLNKANDVQSHRLVQFQLARPPRNHRLRIPTDANARLQSDRLLWWHTQGEGKEKHDVLWSLAIDMQKRRVLPRQPLGQLPSGSLYEAQCKSESGRALLFKTKDQAKRHTLVWLDQVAASPIDVGTASGAVSLSCHGTSAMLTQRAGADVTVWRCDPERCERSLVKGLPGLAEGRGAVAAVGEQLLLVWSEPKAPLRLRLDKISNMGQARDQILLDDPSYSPLSMRLITADGLALLVIQDVDEQLYAVRIDGAGHALAVVPARSEKQANAKDQQQ